MDISLVTRPQVSVWCKFGDDAEVRVKHITREALMAIYKKATKINFNNHQKTEEFDPIKADVLLGQAAIEEWKGFENGEDIFPCTPENIEIMMRKHGSFAKFINEVCVDIELLDRVEKEQAQKNS
jgi:hypothetical protein